MITQFIIRILHPDIPQGVSTIIVLVLFFGGVQLMAISILGEYLGKIFEETKNRPKFIVKSLIHKGKYIKNEIEINNLKKK